MADEAGASSPAAKSAAKGKTKAQKLQAATEDNPRLEPYKFTDKIDPNYLKSITDDAIWQAGPPRERVLPLPPWATLVWGPLPLREDTGLIKKLIAPGSGGGRKKENEPTDVQTRSNLYKSWSKSPTTGKVIGSRNLSLLKTAELGIAHVTPYLGFPDHGALAAFALTEGMS